VLGVERLELLRCLVVAENALVDRLEEQASGDDVECRVILDVLQGDLDDRLIKLLGGDAIEKRELELRRDLGHPRDVRVEAGTGVLDREVDLVGVVRLSRAIALNYGNSHEMLLFVHSHPGVAECK